VILSNDEARRYDIFLVVGRADPLRVSFGILFNTPVMEEHTCIASMQSARGPILKLPVGWEGIACLASQGKRPGQKDERKKKLLVSSLFKQGRRLGSPLYGMPNHVAFIGGFVSAGAAGKVK
jgi:hypothetical protein